MLSLIAQRLVGRLPTASLSLARGSVVLPVLTLHTQSQTRRTFLTGSPRLAVPAATKKPTTAASAKKSTTTAGGAKKKAAVKKPAAMKTATKAKAKPKAKPKRKVAAKKKPIVKKKPKVKKPVKPIRPKLTPADFPPRGPCSAYVFFYTKHLKSLPAESKPKTIADVIQCSKTAGHLWGSMSDAEKEPYKEEERKAKAAYQVQHELYWKGANRKTLAEINRRRRLRGKNAIRMVTLPEDKRPLSGFLRFMNEFRNSPNAQTIKDNTSESKSVMCALAKAGGSSWRAMSEEEKAKYNDAARRDREAWKIKHKA